MEIKRRINCIIVDDDLQSIEYLSQSISSLENLNVLKTYTDPIVAMKDILHTKQQVDILFLDIDMPQISGLDVALVVRHKIIYLVFVTAHAKHSLEAYDVLCNQYLLKPFTLSRFQDTINKLYQHVRTDVDRRSDFFFLKTGSTSKIVKVFYDEIICVSGLEHYVTIHTLTNKFIQHATLKDVETLLSQSDKFIRIHKSHIVSIKHIVGVVGATITLSNNMQVSIGGTYKKSFANFLATNSLG